MLGPWLLNYFPYYRVYGSASYRMRGSRCSSNVSLSWKSSGKFGGRYADLRTESNCKSPMVDHETLCRHKKKNKIQEAMSLKTILGRIFFSFLFLAAEYLIPPDSE